MCVRIIVIAAAVNGGILTLLAPAIGAMGATGLILAWVVGRERGTAGAHRLENPFQLRQAVVFAVLFAAVMLAVRAAQEYLGPSGLLVVSGLSAVVDVDAATIAVTRTGPSSDAWRTAAAAVTAAAVVNTLVKLGIGLAGGAGAFRRLLAVALGAMAAVGAAAAIAIGWG
jgi:uncharacterized membrane protein (DUF4010 family)